ncbi:unnamed protein product [Urochloa humidicola]
MAVVLLQFFQVDGSVSNLKVGAGLEHDR